MHGRDVFICHAGADKISHARPLYNELNRHGLSCWIDEAEIRPGDDIVQKVGVGLINARYVLVIVTENFMGRDWTETELNAALAREINSGATAVIAVLDVDLNSFATRYPLLAHKLHVKWSEGPESIAYKINSLFSREPAQEWHCNHPREYVGMVWIRLVPAAENAGSQHQVTLRWGPFQRLVDIPANAMPSSLAHHKTKPDSVTLHASVSPAAVLNFGCGRPPDARYINIDEGWTRSSSNYSWE
ncbi:hypothetical protein GCM10010492_60290 [Saccharothrix mutabilis subsp. mutabilis]|uniref:TIR domain-containing protein n=2 Tax=Saccharothrix mutabilis TaxID=33921 RepID=A0ABP3E719_9PSEU